LWAFSHRARVINFHMNFEDLRDLTKDPLLVEVVVAEEWDSRIFPLGVLRLKDIEGVKPHSNGDGIGNWQHMVSSRLIPCLCEEHDGIDLALDVMEKNGLQTIPVITRRGELVGVVEAEELREVRERIPQYRGDFLN